jgi:SAM-dependent methyltransferase
MKRKLETIFFDPAWWAIFINPHFLSRRALAARMREDGAALRGTVLDVGCGSQPYLSFLTTATRVTGLELDSELNRTSKNADVFYDGRTFPFPDASFGGVLCNQVLEHVADPLAFLAEIARVLEPGGTLVLSVPFVWPEHEQPWDNQRFTSFGLASAIQSSGLRIVRYDKLVPGAAALCALAADAINARISGLPKLVRIFSRLLLVAPWSVLGALWPNGKREPSIFLDNFVVAEKPPGRS